MEEKKIQEKNKREKIAIVLFNLGGPLGPQDTQPFLFNLFNDPAILRLPSLIRTPLAHLISRRRAPAVQENYNIMGGFSPLLKNTQAQADKLQDVLNKNDEIEYKCFIAMRYWKPFTQEAVRQVRDFSPTQIILLPLYPQFSTTTSGSSLKLWHKEWKRTGQNIPAQTICCYPTLPGFIQAQAESIRAAYHQAQDHGKPIILFSAHGLPEMVIKDGDPYQHQCEATTQKIIQQLNMPALKQGQDWQNCYQSRVGPLKWIGPDTATCIQNAAQQKRPIIVVPIAFVSEHIETLVELDHEYAHLARENGCPHYARTPTVSVHPVFMEGLAEMITARVTQAQAQDPKPATKTIGPGPGWPGCATPPTASPPATSTSTASIPTTSPPTTSPPTTSPPTASTAHRRCPCRA